MNIPTQINGSVTESEKLKVSAVTQKGVIEVNLTERQKYELRYGQTYIQFPDNTYQVNFELEDKCYNFEFTRETRIYRLSMFEKPAKYNSPGTRLTAEGKAELERAIKKSFASDLDEYGMTHLDEYGMTDLDEYGMTDLDEYYTSDEQYFYNSNPNWVWLGHK
jgi:hypothetical protein